MTWWAVGAAAVSVAGGVYNANKAEDSASSALKRTLSAGQDAQDLLQMGYFDAEQRLSPFIASETAANRQLMLEMGLTPDYSNQMTGTTMDLDTLRAELAELEANVPETFKTEDFNAKDYFDPEKNQKYHNPLEAIRSRSKRKKVKKKAKAAKRQWEQEKAQYDSYIARAEQLESQIAQQEAQQAEFESIPSQPGQSAYMNTPGYQGAIDEGVRTVNQGSANQGALYSGARGEALRDVGQNVQQSYYSNYMNILQNMANPATTTNLSNIGIGTAGNIGAQNIASANTANQYALMGTEAKNAGYADVAGGITSAIGAYMNRPQQPQTEQTTYWV